jgi:hypothetical protein
MRLGAQLTITLSNDGVRMLAAQAKATNLQFISNYLECFGSIAEAKLHFEQELVSCRRIIWSC